MNEPDRIRVRRYAQRHDQHPNALAAVAPEWPGRPEQCHRVTTSLVTVTQTETGAVVAHLHPFPDARSARRAAGMEAGQPLTWTRDAQGWIAELSGFTYRVPADPPLE